MIATLSDPVRDRSIEEVVSATESSCLFVNEHAIDHEQSSSGIDRHSTDEKTHHHIVDTGDEGISPPLPEIPEGFVFGQPRFPTPAIDHR